jgi:small subunit ribosomal protein S9
MINFKQLFHKSVQLQCRNAFSTVRSRNFFEVDPIFPDANDPDRQLDTKKLHFAEVFAKEEDQFTAFMEHGIHKAYQKYPKADPNALKERKKRDNAQIRKERRENNLRSIASNILSDPDLGLPYGLGFDEYIQDMKVSRLSSSDDAFLGGLNKLMTKLKTESDLELVELHRTTLIEKTKDDFKDRAKAIVLQNVIREVLSQRQNQPTNKRLLNKLIKNQSVIDAAIAAPELDQATIRQLEENLDSERIENAAENLADQSIKYTVSLHRESRAKENRPAVDREIHNILLSTHVGGKIADYNRDTPGFKNYENIAGIPRDYPVNVLEMTDAEFRAYQIKQEIEDRYNIKRDDFIKRNYSERNPKEEEMEALADTKTTKRQKDLERYRKEQQSDTTKTKEFFLSFSGDDQVNDLEVGLGINNKAPRSFEEIYDEVDKVLLNAPISFQKVVNEGANKNTTFKPHFAHLAINPNDLLWGSLKPLLQPVIPERFKEDGIYSSVPAMKEVLHPTEADLGPVRGRRKIPSSESIDPIGTPQPEPVSFDVSEVTPEMQREIEIFRYVRNEPYFKHHLTNELRYFSDRMNDDMSQVAAGIAETRTGINDYREYDLPINPKTEAIIQKQALVEPIIYNGKSYAGAQRKKAKALAIVKEGSGKITINRKTFIDYFGTVSARDYVIQPLMCSGYSVGMDVDFFLWGGGVHAQVEAASLALAKALIKYNPSVKKSMRENGLMVLDKRQTERKHVGLYKARAKYPYQRR